jgi:1,2-phenylacetyl-CoA epoxidase catalytic subunit
MPKLEAIERLQSSYCEGMDIFGRARSPKNQVYRWFRLKLRDNDEVREAFATEVAELCEKFGLSVPEWKPKWSDLPEEAYIPG